MKFAIDTCPICGDKLDIKVTENQKGLYVCLNGESEATLEAAQNEKDTMPTAHRYEVLQTSLTSWIQDVDIPPFALDSEFFIENEREFYKTTLYKWSDERKVPDSPGWTIVGEYPYIPIEKAEKLIKRLKILILFS